MSSGDRGATQALLGEEGPLVLGGTPCARRPPPPRSVHRDAKRVAATPTAGNPPQIFYTPKPTAACGSCRAPGVGFPGTPGSGHLGIWAPTTRAGHPGVQGWVLSTRAGDSGPGLGTRDQGQTPQGPGTDTRPRQRRRGMGPRCEAPPSCSRQFPSLFSPLLDSSWQDGAYKYT